MTDQANQNLIEKVEAWRIRWSESIYHKAISELMDILGTSFPKYSTEEINDFLDKN